jgi:indolepyruvate ferredoxin oxidoreductase alpha subunit
MERKYLLGNEAIAHACIESGVDFVSGYPGTPSSEVIDTLRMQPELAYYVEWSVNEKVALENALATPLGKFCRFAPEPFIAIFSPSF